eukprot:471751_1
MGINYLIFYLYIQTKNTINSLLTTVSTQKQITQNKHKSLKSDTLSSHNNSDSICNSYIINHNINKSNNKYNNNKLYYELNNNYHQQTNCHDFYYNLYQNPPRIYFPGWNDNISYCINELENNYIIGTQIGKGMYSKVHYAKHISNINNKIYAIKYTKYKSNTERLRFIKENKYQSFYSRIKCYLCFDNYYKNEIISIWDCYSHTLLSTIPFIKYFDSNLIKKEQIISKIIYKILIKLLYLHSNDIIHHDLKPENILITNNGNILNNNFDIFIIDYGFSEQTKYDLLTEINRIIPRYTLSYCSWELLQCIDGKKRGQIKYNEKIDIYALGIICMELLLNGNNIIFNNKNRNNYIAKMSKNIIKKRNIV